MAKCCSNEKCLIERHLVLFFCRLVLCRSLNRLRCLAIDILSDVERDVTYCHRMKHLCLVKFILRIITKLLIICSCNLLFHGSKDEDIQYSYLLTLSLFLFSFE